MPPAGGDLSGEGRGDGTKMHFNGKDQFQSPQHSGMTIPYNVLCFLVFYYIL